MTVAYVITTQNLVRGTKP